MIFPKNISTIIEKSTQRKTEMGKSMLIKEIPVYSDEFDIRGVIKDFGII